MKALHPSQWSIKVYAIAAGVLATLNLLGPNGFVHWVLLRQEASRLEVKAAALQSEVDAVRNETRHFKSSRIAKERAIREELGYLKPDEISVEISP